VITVGTLLRRARAGRTALRFGGFVYGRSLAVGAYRVAARVTDRAGNVSRARRAPFTIVRRSARSTPRADVALRRFPPMTTSCSKGRGSTARRPWQP
jgi:hypothetical protein